MLLEPLHPIQIARFRAMSAEEKWAVARGLLRTAREVRRVAITRRHPEWNVQQIERELARELACMLEISGEELDRGLLAEELERRAPTAAFQRMLEA